MSLAPLQRETGHRTVLRVCAEPGCPTLASGRHCAPHAKGSARNHRGVPRQTRGHGAEYDRARALLLASGPRCHWGCGRRATTADYVVPWSQGGTLADLVASCGSCNFARGAAIARSIDVAARG